MIRCSCVSESSCLKDIRFNNLHRLKLAWTCKSQAAMPYQKHRWLNDVFRFVNGNLGKLLVVSSFSTSHPALIFLFLYQWGHNEAEVLPEHKLLRNVPFSDTPIPSTAPLPWLVAKKIQVMDWSPEIWVIYQFKIFKNTICSGVPSGE